MNKTKYRNKREGKKVSFTGDKVGKDITSALHEDKNKKDTINVSCCHGLCYSKRRVGEVFKERRAI